jgi:RNA polymerase sigma factor (sigma-70 family)
MIELDDHELLADYARTGSEAAFAVLVARYVNLVHSAAWRFTGNPHHAEEITQAVFIILARKAGGLRRGTVLSGWLYQTARLTAANFVKGEIRRQRREQEAYMQSISTEPEPAAWKQIAPLLDEAMGWLGKTDRNAIVLRFFENKTARQVAAALKLNEAAAHKRVDRALEKLHRYFARRGVSSTTAIIAGAISANSVQAAPVALAKAATAAAITKGAAASGSTLTLIQGALKLMACTKIKTAVVVGAAVILAAGTPITVHVVRHQRAEASLYSSKTELTDEDNANYQEQTGTTPAQVAQAIFDLCAQEKWAEADKYWQTGPRNKNAVAAIPDSIKRYYGGLQIVSLGKPFKARLSIAALLKLQPELRREFKNSSGDFPAAGVFVPYEIRLKDGSVKKWQLSIRCDNPEHRWYFDGGM